MMIKVIYFSNNEYLALEGMVSNIDTIEHKITIKQSGKTFCKKNKVFSVKTTIFLAICNFLKK